MVMGYILSVIVAYFTLCTVAGYLVNDHNKRVRFKTRKKSISDINYTWLAFLSLIWPLSLLAFLLFVIGSLIALVTGKK